MRLELRERGEEEERKKRGKIGVYYNVHSFYSVAQPPALYHVHTFPRDIGLIKQYGHMSSLNIAFKKLI